MTDATGTSAACETCGSTDRVSAYGMDGTPLCWEHMLRANRIEDGHASSNSADDYAGTLPHHDVNWKHERDAIPNSAAEDRKAFGRALYHAAGQPGATRNRVIDPDTVHLAGDLMPKCMVMLMPDVLRLLDEADRGR